MPAADTALHAFSVPPQETKNILKDKRKEEGIATDRHCRNRAILATSPCVRVIAFMT
jgi:hypothetical protein